MTNNRDDSTLGFFGDPDLRALVLRSITAYLQIGLAILIPLLATIAFPLLFMWENRKQSLFRNPTFWGALLGYGLGMTFNLASLGKIKRHDIVYKPDHGFELGDPEIASTFPAAGAVVIGVTTLVSVGAAKSVNFAYNKCKNGFAVSRATTDTDDDIELVTQRLTNQASS